MTWGWPIAATTVALTAAVAAALTVVAYIIKMRRRQFEVPFSTLWRKVLDQRDANALWKQFKRWLSLLLVLFILGLMIVASLAPMLDARDHRAHSIVILIDASASMKTLDGDRDRPKLTRLQRAKERTRELIDSLGGGDLAMIMRVDGQATPLTRFDSDKPMLRAAVDRLAAVDTPSDLSRALSAAADALRGRQNPMIVLVSDGAYAEQQLAQVAWSPASMPPPTASMPPPTAPTAPPIPSRFDSTQLAAVDLSGIDVRYLGVGARSDNVGIVAFNVRRYIANKASYEVFIEVQNFGPEPATRQLALYNGDTAIEIKPLELAPGQRVREIYRQLPGGESTLRASLRPGEGPGGTDPFALDDQAWALLPARKKQNVLLVTADNLYLEGAMLVYDNIEVYKTTPAEYDADPATAAINADTKKPYDVVVFDDHTPAVIPPAPTHLLYFHPSGEHTPIAIRGVAQRPVITDVASDHPVMRWVQLKDTNILDSNVFAPQRDRGEVALASYLRDPVIAARRDGRRKTVAVGFSLAATDLTLRVAFPLLLVNCLDWFAGDDADLVTTYATGQRLRIPLDGAYGAREVTVIDPAGNASPAPVVEGLATFYGQRVGIHQLNAYAPDDRDKKAPIATLELAANLASPTESRIAPAAELALGGKQLAAAPTFAVSARRDLWIYVIYVVVALLVLEWVTYHRRVTV